MIDLESGRHAPADARTLSVSRRASLPSRGLVPMNKMNLRRNRAPSLTRVARAAQYFAESIGRAMPAVIAETCRTTT
jgi:hypothetical protein